MSHQFETEAPPNLQWHQFAHQSHLVTTGVPHYISIVYYCSTTVTALGAVVRDQGNEGRVNETRVTRELARERSDRD